MTLRTNARIAGFMFLFYIVTSISSMVLFSRATAGAEGTAAVLASLAQHPTLAGLSGLLTLLTFVDAVVLAVALYALTRGQDRDLALLALCCRVAEGVISAISAIRVFGLLSLAKTAAEGALEEAAAVNTLGALLLRTDGILFLVAGTCFAVGSTIFSYLFLRARSIPAALAWLGVVGSVLVVVVLPLDLAGFLSGPATYLVWIPVALFEVVLGVWLLIKGVAAPTAQQSPLAHA